MAKIKVPTVISDKPVHAGIILTTLILGAVTANLNMSIANLALPSIGHELNASQVSLTMVASTFTLGLAATVLYLGAVGDRYGRKILLLCGAALSIPASLVAAYAPNVEILIGARLVGGFAAGMLYPTTLSLISALWRGPAKAKAIALWSGTGAGAAALGNIAAGILLERFWWGSVFLITVPLAALVLVATIFVIPGKTGESDKKIDNLGGILSMIAVAGLILGIQQLPNGWSQTLVIALVVSAIAFVLLYLQLRHAPNPLVDLKLAAVPTFWVSSVAGIISFGSLVAAMFLGTQYTQNVLNFNTLEAALVVLPCSILIMVTAPISARLLLKRGSRFTMALGMLVIALGFLIMIFAWVPGAGIPRVAAAYAVVGIGVGFTMTPTSRSLMSSLPQARAGMGSAFNDLNRDLGGAIMQAIMGSALAIGYSNALHTQARNVPPQELAQIDEQSRSQILSSYESAEVVAKQYPADLDQTIMSAAEHAFTVGKSAAYVIGLALTILAVILVLWKYPSFDGERAIFERVEEEDPDIDHFEATEDAEEFAQDADDEDDANAEAAAAHDPGD